MAFGDYAVAFLQTNIETAVAKVEQLHPAKAQFTRPGHTGRFFNVQTRKFEGKQLTYRVFTEPMRGAIEQALTVAAAAEAPVARDITYRELAITEADLSMIWGSVKWNELQEQRMADPKVAVYNLATRLVNELESDIGAKVSEKIWARNSKYLAKVKEIYDPDGSTWTGAAGHTPAFITISDGSISMFTPGMILDIYDSTSTGGSDVQNHVVRVLDVMYDGDSPPTAAGVRVANLGQGIVVEPCSITGSRTAGTEYAYTWQSTMGSGSSGGPAVGDFIAQYGEFTTTTASAPFHGIPDFFDPTVQCWRDKDATLIDRTAVTNAWMNPTVITPTGASAGSEIAFDMARDFRKLSNILPYMIDYGRNNRQYGISDEMPSGPEDALQPMEALTFVSTIEIVNGIVDDAQGLPSFTSALALAPDLRKKFFGEIGFDGMIYHCPTLPPIAFVADPLAIPYRGWLLDPNSFFYLVFGDQGSTPGAYRWMLDSAGKRFERIPGTNQRKTFYWQGSAYTTMGLFCDQPRVNVMFQHIKSPDQ